MVWRFIITLLLCVVTGVTLSGVVSAQTTDGRLITVYDRGVEQAFLSSEPTIGEALRVHGISLDSRDSVEPSLDQDLIASEYQVNIYRARPVVVVDGAVRLKAVSPFQTAQQIAKDVGITVYEEDMTTLRPLTNIIRDGAGLELVITRSTPIVLDLYGNKTTVRTQAKTVGEMLTEKNIALGTSGRVSIPLDTPISPGLQVRVWREGRQTVSVERQIPVTSDLVYDADRPIGYRVTQTKGTPGLRTITYQLEVKNGVEISREEIVNIITRKPTKQVEVIGIRNDGAGLTESKGAQQFIDSQGVAHRETYYDLNMSVVMQSCGQGGLYSVRPDGAKVDADGYVIVAANYAIYPKCSVVETSLGPGKVYDTGGFVLRHPYGFDLATDWTRGDGL